MSLSIKGLGLTSHRTLSYNCYNQSNDGFAPSFGGIQPMSKNAKITSATAGVLFLANGCYNFVVHQFVPHFSREKILLEAENVFRNTKLEIVRTPYAIAKVLRGEELDHNYVNNLMERLNSSDKNVYDSEEAGLGSLVLAIAADSSKNKDLIDKQVLKQDFIKCLKPDLNFDGIQSSSGGMIYEYPAAAYFVKNNPEMLQGSPIKEFTPPSTFKEFAVGLWGSFMGKTEPKNYTMAEVLNYQDQSMARKILISNPNNFLQSASSNSWFGRAACGWALRGHLNPEKYGYKVDDVMKMSDSELLNLITRNRINESSEYFMIVRNLKESISEKPTEVVSGESALALDFGKHFTKDLGKNLIKQIIQDMSRENTFNEYWAKTFGTRSEASGLKAIVLARNDMYGEIPAESRAKIREFQIKFPDTPTAAMFVIAEDIHMNKLSQMLTFEQSTLEKAHELEYAKKGNEICWENVVKTAQDLINFDEKIIKILNNEIKVEQQADPAGKRMEELIDAKKHAVAQREKVINNLKKSQKAIYYTKSLEEVNAQLREEMENKGQSTYVLDSIIKAFTEINVFRDAGKNLGNISDKVSDIVSVLKETK